MRDLELGTQPRDDLFCYEKESVTREAFERDVDLKHMKAETIRKK